jgi:hypothetical protein
MTPSPGSTRSSQLRVCARRSSRARPENGQPGPQVPCVEEDADRRIGSLREQLLGAREICHDRELILRGTVDRLERPRTPASRPTLPSSRTPSTTSRRAPWSSRSPTAPVRNGTTSGSNRARRRIEPASAYTRVSGSAGSGLSSLERMDNVAGRQTAAFSRSAQLANRFGVVRRGQLQLRDADAFGAADGERIEVLVVGVERRELRDQESRCVDQRSGLRCVSGSSSGR